jgi:hypothetical protein
MSRKEECCQDGINVQVKVTTNKAHGETSAGALVASCRRDTDLQNPFGAFAVGINIK